VFVALGIEHAKWMRLIILSSVYCLGLPHFSTLSHKGQDFRKKKWDKKCVLIFSANLSVVFLLLRRIERDIIINVHRYLCEVRGIFVIF
jgi:hypothetical protein